MEEVQAIKGTRDQIRANIEANSHFDTAYVVMNGLATVVACYGLFENSAAVVIGAMIIAMLLGPIAGVSLGLVDRNNGLLWKALPTLLGGFLVVFATAFLLGLIHRDIPLTDQIYARTAPNLLDLLIALGGGAAGAYSMISPRLSVAFVGVAIATALVPPVSSSAICLARGEYALAFGAFLLAFTNIVGIQVAGSLVMWLAGYRGSPKTSRFSPLKRNLLSVVVLCALAIFLSGQLENLVSKQIYQQSVRKLLTSAASGHNGAYLIDVRFRELGNQTVVVAVYRTPSPFTPEEVSALEPKLPQRSGAKNLELLVRSVPITVASKSGYLFSDEDMVH
jgi:uncharacterized hydrophobic protein (TIGR00271 family)